MSSEATTPKRMTQSDVLNHFAEKFGLKRNQVKEFFDELATLAGNEAMSNGQFMLPGFGRLVLAERQAREGRNPATGESITIPAKTSLKFRLSKTLKDAVVEDAPSPQ